MGFKDLVLQYLQLTKSQHTAPQRRMPCTSSRQLRWPSNDSPIQKQGCILKSPGPQSKNHKCEAPNNFKHLAFQSTNVKLPINPKM